MYQRLPSIIIMTANVIGIIFTQIELECFYEDIVGEHVDCHPRVKPVCSAKFSTSHPKDLLSDTHLGLLLPTTSFIDVQHAFHH